MGYKRAGLNSLLADLLGKLTSGGFLSLRAALFCGFQGRRSRSFGRFFSKSLLPEIDLALDIRSYRPLDDLSGHRLAHVPLAWNEVQVASKLLDYLKVRLTQRQPLADCLVGDVVEGLEVRVVEALGKEAIEGQLHDLLLFLDLCRVFCHLGACHALLGICSRKPYEIGKVDLEVLLCPTLRALLEMVLIVGLVVEEVDLSGIGMLLAQTEGEVELADHLLTTITHQSLCQQHK